MNKKVYNLQNSKRQIVGKVSTPLINLSFISGTISFSNIATSTLQLLNKKIYFVQDEDNPKDWYIEITHQSDGIQFVKKKEKNSKKDVAIFSSKMLVDNIMNSLGFTVTSCKEKGYTSANFIISLEVTPKDKLFPIITSSIYFNKKRLK